MKKFRKLLSLVLAMVMVLAMAAPSFAANGTGSITINNASKGETYYAYKLFDATVANGSIAYTGTIPSELNAYFEVRAGYIYLKDGVTDITEEFSQALQSWAAAQGTENATASDTADGSALVLENLEYGYYVVTTTQGSAISVDSLNPDATIYDKNLTEPSEPADGDVKSSDVDPNKGAAIGDTITYTVEFTTTNYVGEGEDAKKVKSYTIHDTLPETFLDNVNVTSILIDGESYTVGGSAPQFIDNEITIPWVNGAGNSMYNNGALIKITYTAVLKRGAVIDGSGNTNTVSISWTTEDEVEHTGDLMDTETVYTYALAIQKVDQAGKPLAGATFSIGGIQATEEEKGIYIVTKAGEDVTEPTVMECDDNGLLIVKGVQLDTYSVTEVAAPEGYNKLEGSFDATAQKIGETVTTTTTYYNEDGEETDKESAVTTLTTTNEELLTAAKKVMNKAGATLPSTGGIGTTVFYAAGIVLMAGAVFFVVRRKKA